MVVAGFIVLLLVPDRKPLLRACKCLLFAWLRLIFPSNPLEVPKEMKSEELSSFPGVEERFSPPEADGNLFRNENFFFSTGIALLAVVLLFVVVLLEVVFDAMVSLEIDGLSFLRRYPGALTV